MKPAVATVASEPVPAPIIGRYTVVGCLARGLSNVYVAEQPEKSPGDRYVCIKTLDPAAIDEDVRMFEDESRIGRLVTHPGCVRTIDSGTQGELRWLASELVTGISLADLIAYTARADIDIPHPEVAEIVAQIADGLAYLHEMQDEAGTPLDLVHRDVCPHNVVIDLEGAARVLDYGIAKGRTGRASTARGVVKGRFMYMAPEHITGGRVDPRCDIYALGVLMWETIARRRYHTSKEAPQIAQRVLTDPPRKLTDIVPDVHPALDEIFRMATATDPAARYQTAAQMRDDLRRYLRSVRTLVDRPTIAVLLKDALLVQGAATTDDTDPHPLDVLGAMPLNEHDRVLLRGEVPSDPPPPYRGIDTEPSGEVPIASPRVAEEIEAAFAQEHEPSFAQPRRASPAKPATPPALRAQRARTPPSSPRPAHMRQRPTIIAPIPTSVASTSSALLLLFVVSTSWLVGTFAGLAIWWVVRSA